MSEWKTCPLEYLCSDIIDCVNKTAPVSTIQTKYKMLRTSDVRDGRVNLNNLNSVSEETFIKWSRRGVLKRGDIILTREAPLGEVGMIKEPDNLFLGQRLVLLRADETVCDSRFLLYALMFHDNKQSIISKGSGSTVSHLRVPECKKITIKAPELNIQHRIADILSAYDDLIENNRRQIKLLEEAAQRLYKEWFVDLRFPGHESVKIVDGVPEGWEIDFVGNLCSLRKTAVAPENVSPELPYIGLEHIPRHDFCLSEWGAAADISSKKYLYSAGDIIFGQIRPYFHKVGFAINNGVASTDSFVMRPVKELWGLFLLTVSSDAFVSYAHQTCKEGAKMPRADWKQMKEFQILIPEQKILNMFEIKIKIITDEIKTLVFQNHKLTEARDRLLPQLLSGQLEV